MTAHNDRLEFLLAAAAWQDSLLQAYRTLFLALQAVLLALGTALFAAGLTMKSPVQVYVVSALVLAVALGGLLTHWRLKNVIEMRSSDVDFWHREILLCETSSAPAERLFTRFKIYQQGKETKRMGSDPCRDALLENHSIRDLTCAGLGYTREVIDSHVARTLLGGWGLLLVGAFAYTAIVAIFGVPFR